MVNHHLGRVCIARSVLQEAPALSEADCHDLGLQIVDGSVKQLLEAGEERGALSFNDRLCLILASAGGWACVTNDKALRKACGERSIPVLWGLEPMIELVARGVLPRERALETARAVQRSNPQHITPDILQRFEARLDSRG